MKKISAFPTLLLWVLLMACHGDSEFISSTRDPKHLALYAKKAFESEQKKFEINSLAYDFYPAWAEGKYFASSNTYSVPLLWKTEIKYGEIGISAGLYFN